MKLNSNSLEQINAQYGKLPPQAIEVEEAVLGAYILERDAILENPINPAWFYKDEHQKIASCIVELNKKGKKIDLMTVTQSLKDNNLIDEIGGIAYIMKLTKKVSSAAHLSQWLKVIQEKFIRRELIRLSYEIQTASYDETIETDQILSKLNTNSLDIMDYSQESISTLSDVLIKVTAHINTVLKGNQMTGIPTGFAKLDGITGGWQGSDLVIIAAESSQGKTSFVLNTTTFAGLNNVPGVIYSLEMSNVQLGIRIVSSIARVNSKRILVNPLSSFELHDIEYGIKRLNDVPIYFDDNVNNTLDSICMSIRRMVLKFKIKYAVVDYLQNIKKLTGESDETSLGIISKTLKNLAKELNITIFLLSQLARDREKPLPTMNRLRGSGQIEETADIVIMIYRAEYYGKNFPEPYEDESTNGRALIIIGKGRNIGIGSFLANFDKTTVTFSDIEEVYTEQQKEIF